MKENEKNYLWTVQEFKYLAKTIRRLKIEKTRNVNKVAAEILGRNQQGIQKIRTKTEYKQIEKRIREEEQSSGGENIEVEENNRGSNAPENTVRLERDRRPETPKNTVRQQLPVIPPTPIPNNESLLQKTLEQQSLSLMNTPTDRRKLPQTPITSKQLNTSKKKKVIDSDAQTPISHSVRPRTNNVGILTTVRKPDYKKAAYLDARSYSETLNEDKELHKTLKVYLTEKGDWYGAAKVIAVTERKIMNERERIRKGPWMKNKRDNHKTKKAKIYQFTQKAYEQNNKATMNEILTSNFGLDNSEQTFPDIAEVEKVYEKRLEQGNQTDNTSVQYPEEIYSSTYGKFIEEEVGNCMKELNKNTAAGVDRILTEDLRKMPLGHITSIMNYW